MTDLANLLQRVVGRSVRLTLSLDPTLGLIHADRGQLEQVVMNLVLNARDALPDVGEIAIATFNVVREGSAPNGPPPAAGSHYIGLEVTDNGCGMSADTRAHLFEAHFTTKTPERGSGLGLTIVKQVVTENHGEIDVASEPGRGASFTLYFPESRWPEPSTGPSTLACRKEHCGSEATDRNRATH